MNKIHELPIFCDNCATLALAVLDGAPLCEHCLMEAVHLADDREIARRIAPLQFKEPRSLTSSFSFQQRGFAA